MNDQERGKRRASASRREFIAGGSALGLFGFVGPGRAQERAATVVADALAGADLALINGQFIDYRGNVGNNLTIANGRIASVGSDIALAEHVPVIDLGGRTVIPGLVDSHVHYTRAGVSPGYQERRIERAFSIGSLSEIIADRVQTVPRGEFITCIGGWNHRQFVEARPPTRTELDEAAPDHAVYLAATGGGTGAITNRLGAEFFMARGVDVDLDSGSVASPRDALAALQSVQTAEDKLRGTEALNAHASALGLTTVINAGNFDDQGFALSLWREGRLNIRMRPLFPAGSPEEVEARARNNFGQRGRAVGDDLYRPAGFGERIGGTNTMSDQLEPTARVIAQYGWLLQQHSITSEENAFHLEIFERIAREQPIGALHWALIHLREISAEHLARLGALGAGASAQTWTYLSNAGGPPFRRIVESGIPAAVGTDSTNVSALDPWLSLFYMTTGRNLAGELTNDGQQISRLEALELYTRGAAWFSFDQDAVGSFEPGKLADLAVLSHDYLAVSDAELRQIESVFTLVGGRVTHAAEPFV